LHELSLPAAEAQNNYLKKKFLCMPLMTISIFSRTLVFNPKFAEHLQRPPIETPPPSSYVAVNLARLPRKLLPQSGTSYLPTLLLKTNGDKIFFEAITT
jgi:hypothetical protein